MEISSPILYATDAGDAAAKATNGQSAIRAADVARRPSQVSVTSSILSVNSDLGFAAQNIVLGRPMPDSNTTDTDALSTQQLFTNFPNTQPNARIQQLRAARLQPGADGDAPKLQAPAMVRIPTDKSIDKQISALGITTRTSDENGSAGETAPGLTGLGIRGADLTPPVPSEAVDTQQSMRQTVIPSHTLRPIDTRLNHSLPSLPLDQTRSNLSAPPMQREKGIFRKKRVKTADEFSENAVPTPMRLWEASQCQIIDEAGRTRRFGDFWDTYTVSSQEESEKISANGKDRIDRIDRRSVKSLNRENGAGQQHLHPDSASSSRLSFNSLGGTGVRDKHGLHRKSKKSKSDVKIGGEEYIVPGRKTVVFCIRHFWCGQCA
jgi:hypothetical protein